MLSGSLNNVKLARDSRDLQSVRGLDTVDLWCITARRCLAIEISLIPFAIRCVMSSELLA